MNRPVEIRKQIEAGEYGFCTLCGNRYEAGTTGLVLLARTPSARGRIAHEKCVAKHNKKFTVNSEPKIAPVSISTQQYNEAIAEYAAMDRNPADARLAAMRTVDQRAKESGVQIETIYKIMGMGIGFKVGDRYDAMAGPATQEEIETAEQLRADFRQALELPVRV